MTLEETYSVWMAKHPLTGELERLLNKKFTIEYNFNSNHFDLWSDGIAAFVRPGNWGK